MRPEPTKSAVHFRSHGPPLFHLTQRGSMFSSCRPCPSKLVPHPKMQFPLSRLWHFIFFWKESVHPNVTSVLNLLTTPQENFPFHETIYLTAPPSIPSFLTPALPILFTLNLNLCPLHEIYSPSGTSPRYTISPNPSTQFRTLNRPCPFQFSPSTPPAILPDSSSPCVVLMISLLGLVCPHTFFLGCAGR